MNKEKETNNQLHKRLLREEREMKWLLHEQKKERKGVPFFIYMMIILCIIYMVDEFSSNVLSGITTQICGTFYPGVEIGVAQGYLTLATFPGYLILFISPFYKSLSDRFGRRFFLAFNVIGMGIAMMIVFFAKSIFFYVIGAVLIQMFTPNDVQVMYVMECAPSKDRAKLAALSKGIGLTSVSLVAFLRTWVFTSWGEERWQMILLIPIIVAFIVGTLSYVTIDETPVFLERRINYLRTSDEERKAQVIEKKKKSIKTFDAFKIIFKNKQLRWITICAFIFAMSTAITGVYEPIMTTFGMSTTEVTKVIAIFPLCNALITCCTGFFIDKLGRKKAIVLMGSFGAIMVSLFIFGSFLHWNPYLIGIFYGSFLGGYWQVSDTMCIYIATESSPTDLRASILGALSLMFGLGGGLSLVIKALGGIIVGNAGLGWLSYLTCLPFLALSIILLMTKVKETAGVDLNNIHLEETVKKN